MSEDAPISIAGEKSCPLTQSTLYYQMSLRGEHPDIKYPQKWKKYPNEAANRAISLYLRDIFTPLCAAFADKVAEVNCKKITAHVCKEVYNEAIFNEQFLCHLARGNLSAVESQMPEKIRQEFQDRYHLLPDAGRKYFVDLLLHTKKVAALEHYRLDELVTGCYRHYFWCPRIKDFSPTVSHAVDTTLVPIGEYGRQCALRMLHTTNILLNLAQDTMAAIAEKLEHQYWDIVAHETARGQAKKEATEALEKNADIYREIQRISR